LFAGYAGKTAENQARADMIIDSVEDVYAKVKPLYALIDADKKVYK
jgi:hypothetical protein